MNVDRVGASGGSGAGATPGPGQHVVRAGETLDTIAAQYGIPRDGLLRANPHLDLSHLGPGQSVSIPGAGTAPSTGGGSPAGQAAPRDTFERAGGTAMLFGGPIPPLPGNQPTATPGPVASLGNAAAHAGLESAEVQQLTSRLDAMPEPLRAREIEFLQSHVLAAADPREALRTYIDLRGRQEQDPLRITDETIHTLTRSVADPAPGGGPPVMTREQALNAAGALSRMPQHGYERVLGWLDSAGGPGGNAQLERSMILRELGTAPFHYSDQQMASVARVTDLVRGRPPEELSRLLDRPEELRFLRDEVMTSPNSSRALDTYRQLVGMQNDHPDRLTDGIIHALTRGVGDRRSYAATGVEGLLGNQQAVQAADRLASMPQQEYNQVVGLLNQAGRHDGQPARGADPQTERSLILKALAAGRSVADISAFADSMRGTERSELVRRSTPLDINWDPRADALQQRWTTSCGPTVIQMAHAEADPIYAWQLHQADIHDLQHPEDPIGQEQRGILHAHGGSAVSRVPGSTGHGAGMSLGGVLDSEVGATCHRHYDSHVIPNTEADRRRELRDVEGLLRQGVDVPMRVEWDSDHGGHFMLMTDVRGRGDDARFLVTDPWTGRTGWISAQDIARGHTDFMAGHGRLTTTYRGGPTP